MNLGGNKPPSVHHRIPVQNDEKTSRRAFWAMHNDDSMVLNKSLRLCTVRILMIIKHQSQHVSSTTNLIMSIIGLAQLSHLSQEEEYISTMSSSVSVSSSTVAWKWLPASWHHG